MSASGVRDLAVRAFFGAVAVALWTSAGVLPVHAQEPGDAGAPKSLAPKSLAPKSPASESQTPEPLAPASLAPATDAPAETAPPAALTRPRALTPRSLTPKAQKPRRDAAPTPAGETAKPGSAITRPGSKPVATPVEAAPLATVNPDAVGTIGTREGSLGASLWRGTERSFVETLMPRLPVETRSRAMRNLMRRLLLTAADVPEGESGGESLIALRVRALAAMGALADVDSLLEAIPGDVTDSQLLQVSADARFIANDLARACEVAARRIREDDSTYWQKALIFCQALAGEGEKVELGLSLLSEVGDDDPAFFSLMGLLLGAEDKAPDSLRDASALHLAIARAAKADLPSDVLASNNPAVLRSISINPKVPVDVRLDAAERAEASGALPTQSLRQLYNSVSFTPEDLGRPLSKAEETGGTVARALLYHAALTQTVPAARAEIVQKALDLARAEGRYDAVARVFHDIVAEIEPSAAELWFAPAAVRLLLSNRDRDTARGWLSLLQTSALFKEENADATVMLTPLVRLVGTLGLEREPTDLAAWWGLVSEDPDVSQRAALLYGLLQAFDEDVPASVWKPLEVSAQRVPVAMIPPVLWFRLQSATEAARIDRPAVVEAQPALEPITPVIIAGAGAEAATDDSGGALAPIDLGQGIQAAPRPRERIGEVIMLSLLALGEAGPAGAAPHAIYQVIRSLRALGLEEDARAVALEAALAAGL